jgi:hypothetical protein
VRGARRRLEHARLHALEGAVNDTPEPPDIHVYFTTDKPEEPHWDFSWMQLSTNAWTAALAFIPANIWAKVLNDVHTQQDLSGAFFMAGAGVVVTVTRFVQKRTWTRRTLVWISVLGAIFALPVFSAMVHVLTGGGR